MDSVTDLLKCRLNGFDCAFVLFLGNFTVQKDFYFPFFICQECL